MMNIIENKTIFSGNASDGTNIATFCGLAQTCRGDLIVTARLGSGKDTADGNAAFWVSRDNGLTWRGPVMPFSTDIAGRKGCLRGGYITELSDGTWVWIMGWVDRSVEGRPLYNKDTGGLCPMFPVLSRSGDKGQTWSEPEKLDILPVCLPAALTGPVLQLGKNILAAQFEVQKEWNDTTPIFNFSTIKLSYDNGKTWPDCVDVAGRHLNGKVCWDQRIAVMTCSRLIALFWAYDPVKDSDLPIHSCFSNDNGLTWSKPQDTGINGQIACPVVISEDDVVMLYVRRDEKKQILARRSRDGGVSWEEKSELCIYNHLSASENSGNFFDAMNQWSYGHPFGIKTGTYEISAVYYAGTAETMELRFFRIMIG